MINFSELLWKPESARSGSRPESGPSPRQRDIYHVAVGKPIEPARIVYPVEQSMAASDARIALVSDLHGSGAERMRLLRMRLRELRDATGLRSLVITSALPQDGKSTIALNLAAALAEGSQRSVLLIEGDLHRPSLATTLKIPKVRGLSECLSESVDPFSLIRRIEPMGFHLLDAGAPCPNIAQLLESERLGEILTSLTAAFDWVLVDTPPVMPLTDALVMSKLVDAALVVARAGSTPKDAVNQTVTLLGAQHVAGVILNCAEALEGGYSYYNARNYAKK